MTDARCKRCSQLQFKYRVKQDKIEIEVKCYSCNAFSYFTIDLPSLQDNDNNHDKD